MSREERRGTTNGDVDHLIRVQISPSMNSRQEKDFPEADLSEKQAFSTLTLHLTGLDAAVESVPGPLRNVQTVRHIVRGVVVISHRGCGCPLKVIV